MSTSFRTVMAVRAMAWAPALSDNDHRVREFAEYVRDTVAPAFIKAYETAIRNGADEATAQHAVYALLDDGIMDRVVNVPLHLVMPYFIAEFQSTGMFAPGWCQMIGPATRFTVRTLLARMRAA